MQESPEAQGKTLSLKPFVADLGDFTQVREAARAFIRNEDRLDILVNNAGLYGLDLPFIEPLAEFFSAG
jgi:NAD(P)-dependent dehydrogenase (short-subunit alcohol dehydrogenase family)